MSLLIKLGKSLTLMLGLVWISTGQLQAAVIVNPAVGGTFTFNWVDGLGPIDGIGGGIETDWSIAVASDTVLSFVTATDLFVPGDEFELVFDGGVVPWDTTSISGGGFFSGSMLNLLLSAGLHTFSLNVISLAPDPSGGFFQTGAASMSFGTVAVVPVPAALPLFGTGLSLLGFFGWRKKRRAVLAA